MFVKGLCCSYKISHKRLELSAHFSRTSHEQLQGSQKSNPKPKMPDFNAPGLKHVATLLPSFSQEDSPLTVKGHNFKFKLINLRPCGNPLANFSGPQRRTVSVAAIITVSPLPLLRPVAVLHVQSDGNYSIRS